VNNLIEDYMSSLFVDDSDPSDPIQRLPLGLYTFDRAFMTADSLFGMPIGTGYEVFGANNVGKSTFCYSLMGLLGNVLDTNIVLADLEGLDSRHLSNVLNAQKYTNKLKLITQGSDEEILLGLQDSVYVKDKRRKDMYGLGMLDSIGAISAYAEANSDLGEANMGRRAILMAQLSRRLLPTIHPRRNKSQKVYFFTNHWYKRVAAQGYDTPGGEVKKYICGVRLLLKRKEFIDKDGSYIIEGRVYKNRYGIKDRKFLLFMKSGMGIHRGLTAMIDCLATRKAKKTKDKKITIEGELIGKYEDIILRHWEDNEFFQPFYNLLNGDEDD
jgi:RecA/RadA recombinase